MCRRQFKLYKKAVRGIIALEQGKARGGMRLAQEEQNQEACPGERSEPIF